MYEFIIIIIIIIIIALFMNECILNFMKIKDMTESCYYSSQCMLVDLALFYIFVKKNIFHCKKIQMLSIVMQ